MSEAVRRREEGGGPMSEIAMIRHDFAPNCVWTFTLPDHREVNRRLLRLIEAERRASPESRECAGREMWQSSRQVTEDEPVREVFKTIFEHAYYIADFLRWDIAGCKPVVKVCWANIHPTGSYHTRHIHPASVHLSGVYYIKTSRNCGNIVFHDLARFLGLWGAAPKTLEPTNYNQSRFSVEPEDGLGLLFPGYIMHEVETNRSEEDRVGLAFNINFEQQRVDQ